MRRLLCAVTCLVLSVASGLGCASTTPAREQARVAAFAKLYGVVRYFYPGDAAQQLDWNRLAVAGVADASTSDSSAELQTRLASLFAPLGPGIDITRDGDAFPPALPAHDQGRDLLVAWRYLGFAAGRNPPYVAARTGRHEAEPFLALSTALPADSLVGKSIRLRGNIAALDSSTTHGLGLWLRVDRKGKSRSFFENTGAHQVHDRGWHEYEIDAKVDKDASLLAFGFTMALRDGVNNPSAGLRDLVLEVSDGQGGWTPIAIPSLASAATAASGWNLNLMGRTDDRASSATWHVTGKDGAYLQIQRRGDVAQSRLFDAPVIAGRTITFPLGAGLQARVALTLTDTQAQATEVEAPALAALKSRLAAMPDPFNAEGSRFAREADVVVGWNVLRHFYPYADVIQPDWKQMLAQGLAGAARASSRGAQRQVLQRLLAPLQDAHGTVVDVHTKARSSLPVSLAPVEQHWIVVASAMPESVAIGAVVLGIDGISMPQARERAEALTSGQPSSRSWKALQELQWGATGSSHAFVFGQADGTRVETSLKYNEARSVRPIRPAPLAELRPGIWYVDVARTDKAMFDTRLAQLASARAVIYDVRGYPKDFQLSKAIPAHLLSQGEHAKWMHIPRYTGPFGEHAGYVDVGWDIAPQLPHFTSRAIFLADGGTVSQAEAIMGYVQDDKLGTIVGSTTRGVDGNITYFRVPTGFNIIFTGMKVTHHDGTSRYHALGTPPDVHIEPTIAGIRAGRDEVLDRALRVATSDH